jgi:hypothetical protein
MCGHGKTLRAGGLHDQRGKHPDCPWQSTDLPRCGFSRSGGAAEDRCSPPPVEIAWLTDVTLWQGHAVKRFDKDPDKDPR